MTGRVEQGTIKTGEDVEILGLTQVSLIVLIPCSTFVLNICHTPRRLNIYPTGRILKSEYSPTGS